MVDDGARVVKIFLHIDDTEQLKRFEERLKNPVKRWKLTEEDLRNRDKWPEYSQAIDEMLGRTSTQQSPWHVIAANHKWYARITTLKTLVKALEEGVDTRCPPLDKDLADQACRRLGLCL